MSQSLSNVLVHIVFSTKDRNPWILPSVEAELHSYIVGISRNLKCPVHQTGGISDHVHLLVSLSRTISTSQLIRDIKAYSSKWVKTQKGMNTNFAWQNGYGAFSIGQSGFHQAVKYIANQKEHHKVKTFKEEFLEFLKLYEIPYEEKYIWD